MMMPAPNQQFYQPKKEIQFPADSVEASLPVDAKKRKLTAKDIAPCDPWKLYMSLKSGLLAESTWALDALNILLYDDSTIAYFHLKHLPGLVGILLEHYVKCLKQVFGSEFGDLFFNNFPFDEPDVDDVDEADEESSDDEPHSTQNVHPNVNSVNTTSSKKKSQVSTDDEDLLTEDEFSNEEDDEDEAMSDLSSDNTNYDRTANHKANNNSHDTKRLNGYCNSNSNHENMVNNKSMRSSNRSSKSNVSYLTNSSKNATRNGNAKQAKGKRGRPAKKTNKTVKNEPDLEEQSLSQMVTNQKYKDLLDDGLKVMKINFTDRDTLNRFTHYYKTFQFNDSKVCEYWYRYNEMLIDRVLKESGRKAETKSKRSRVSAEIRKCQKRELNNYILTSFSAKNDLETLNKLFYGRYYANRCSSDTKSTSESVEPASTNGKFTIRSKTVLKETVAHIN
jgi:hypothetical protein